MHGHGGTEAHTVAGPIHRRECKPLALAALSRTDSLHGHSYIWPRSDRTFRADLSTHTHLKLILATETWTETILLSPSLSISRTALGAPSLSPAGNRLATVLYSALRIHENTRMPRNCGRTSEASKRCSTWLLIEPFRTELCLLKPLLKNRKGLSSSGYREPWKSSVSPVTVSLLISPRSDERSFSGTMRREARLTQFNFRKTVFAKPGAPFPVFHRI